MARSADERVRKVRQTDLYNFLRSKGAGQLTTVQVGTIATPASEPDLSI